MTDSESMASDLSDTCCQEQADWWPCSTWRNLSTSYDWASMAREGKSSFEMAKSG
eukprot:CAMPEP_0181510910 /NCGR_PEP_ID=MMETSP1110-20121109/61136_1 /TAXON_ID=174948 /ORGANISM="Symbiodinium sp., Strain CCMP421" /LENGTH=54 /DNA_ID=CAMNT_0023640579 /DNA_START=107 /DNA_END=267 /DNA_ORIENTATION=-